MTWYPLQPCDEAFFRTAPHVHRYSVQLAVPPERVWASLVSDGALADWGLGLKKLEWLTPRPFGVGTRREVVLPGGAMAVREQFFRWDEGRRKSFYGYEANRPLVRAFAEDYLVEESGSGTKFTWTIAVEPTAKTRLLLTVSDPFNRLAFRAMPMRAKAYFAKHP
jgi:uncharacterized protein YndB with AHSA1/START domain